MKDLEQREEIIAIFADFLRGDDGEMKRFFEMKRFLLVFVLLSVLSACGKSGSEDRLSDAFRATLSSIDGLFSAIDIRWDSPVDISGNGKVSDDILLQLEDYGCSGVQSVLFDDTEESFDVFDANDVLIPQNPDRLGQVNLYMPYFEYGRGRFDFDSGENERIAPKSFEGHCCAQMQPYQFHYSVGADGRIDVRAQDSPRYGDSFGLKNVSVQFVKSGVIVVQADTRLWDFASESFKDGRIEAWFKRRDQ